MTYTGLKATFNEVATVYDAVRPSYPEELIEAVIHLSGLPERGRILEIGCGTGQATLPFAARGYSLRCLEPGNNLAAVAARNFRPYPQVSIQEITFEEWTVETEAFDLVMSAQAFHWILAEIGYPRAAQALKPGGSIALLWNLSPEQEGYETDVWSEVQQQYHECTPEITHERGANPLAAQVQALMEPLQAQNAYFRDVAIQQFPWTIRYDTTQYLHLLNTYSNHLMLPKEKRKCLYDGIAAVIERYGGSVLKQYEAVLMVARKV